MGRPGQALADRPLRFLPLIEALQSEFGQVKVITWHCDAERCGERCQRARGDECTCSCGGVNHGILGVLSGHRRGWRLAGTAAATEQGWSEWVWIASAGMSTSEMAAWIVGEGGRFPERSSRSPGQRSIRRIHPPVRPARRDEDRQGSYRGTPGDVDGRSHHAQALHPGQ